jgi:hypothetical protein
MDKVVVLNVFNIRDGWAAWTGLIWLGIRTVGGLF